MLFSYFLKKKATIRELKQLECQNLPWT